MAKPTRLSQEKLDDLLLKHRQQRNKDLQDQHTIAQRNILVRKMKLARKLQARQEAEAKKALLDTLSTDRPKPLTRSGMAAIASIGSRKAAKSPGPEEIVFQPGMVITQPLSDPDLGEQFLKCNVPERLIKRLSEEQPEEFDLIADDPYTDGPAIPPIKTITDTLPTTQPIPQESDEPPQT